MTTEKTAQGGCGVVGCSGEYGGWIDFGFEGEGCPYARLRFCEKHFETLMKKVEEEIQKERDSGQLKESEGYPIVPWHITQKVIKFKEVEDDN